MYIEKHGNLIMTNKETRSAKFSCNKCHCKFVARPGEYLAGKKNYLYFHVTETEDKLVYISVCPECREIVFLPERVIHFTSEDQIKSFDELLQQNETLIRVESKLDDFRSGIYRVVVEKTPENEAIDLYNDKNPYGTKYELIVSLYPAEMYYSRDAEYHTKYVTITDKCNFENEKLMFFKHDVRQN